VFRSLSLCNNTLSIARFITTFSKWLVVWLNDCGIWLQKGREENILFLTEAQLHSLSDLICLEITEKGTPDGRGRKPGVRPRGGRQDATKRVGMDKQSSLVMLCNSTVLFELRLAVHFTLESYAPLDTHLKIQQGLYNKQSKQQFLSFSPFELIYLGCLWNSSIDSQKFSINVL